MTDKLPLVTINELVQWEELYEDQPHVLRLITTIAAMHDRLVDYEETFFQIGFYVDKMRKKEKPIWEE